MLCEHCGKENESGAASCANCGKPMPPISGGNGFADILSFESRSAEREKPAEYSAEILECRNLIDRLAKQMESLRSKQLRLTVLLAVAAAFAVCGIVLAAIAILS